MNLKNIDRRGFLQALIVGGMATKMPSLYAAIGEQTEDEALKDYLYKIRNPDLHHSGDIQAGVILRPILESVNRRLVSVRQIVGFGNFNVLSFDDMLIYAKRYSQIGAFTKQELELLEALFYTDAARYGFYGEKPLESITQTIDKRSVKKIPRTGHYLFTEKSVDTYKKIRKEIGPNVVLTSGVRGIVKQMQLFVSKAARFEGNLSLASRSLAPPGYSFHGIGDFDVGITGWGAKNFTDAFAETEEFRKLIDLGYIDIRYPIDNTLGVRFEPWHIKIS